MALIMKMVCDEVTERGGGTMLPLCRAHEVLEAWPPPKAELTTVGIWGHGLDVDSDHHCPDCLRLSQQIEREHGLAQVNSWETRRGKGSEKVVLKAVMSGGSEDPNGEWSAATPVGELSATINNPGAWDFLDVGVEYTVEIRRHVPARGRRDQSG